MKRDRSHPIRVMVARAGPKEQCPVGWCRSRPRDLVCLGCCQNDDELFRAIRLRQPDALLVDSGAADHHAIRGLRLVTRARPKLPVVILGQPGDGPEILTALIHGVQGYVLKPASPARLQRVLRQVCAGRPVLGQAALLNLLRTFHRSNGIAPEWSGLSEREAEIAARLALGFWGKEIASELRLSQGAVHQYLQRIFHKLGVHDKKSAVARLIGALSPSLNLGNGQHAGDKRAPPKSRRELLRRFATEEACRKELFDLRWPDGFRCPRCGAAQAWRTQRGLWVCTGCRGQISITAGTLFEGARLPLRAWFRAAWEVAGKGPDAHAAAVMRRLRLGSYETAWTCLKKLSRALDELPTAPATEDAQPRGEIFRGLLQKAVQMPPGAMTKPRRRQEPG